MQRTLVVIVPPSFRLDDFRRELTADPSLRTTANDEGGLDVRSALDSASYVFVDGAPERQLAVDDYRDNDELDESFRATVADKEFVILIASSMDLLRRITRRLLESSGTAGSWVDDDYGHVVPADRFLVRLAAEPEWNLIAQE